MIRLNSQGQIQIQDLFAASESHYRDLSMATSQYLALFLKF